MMTESVRCCQELPDFPAAKSPFSKLVILGYYDGATSGVLQCEMCQTAYRFEMLDWDEKQKVRNIALPHFPKTHLTISWKFSNNVENNLTGPIGF